jgi:hypothetical protein
MASAGSPKTHIIPLSQFKSATQAQDDAREVMEQNARNYRRRRIVTDTTVKLGQAPVEFWFRSCSDTLAVSIEHETVALLRIGVCALHPRPFWCFRYDGGSGKSALVREALALAQPLAGVCAAPGGLAMSPVLGVTVKNQSGRLCHGISLDDDVRFAPQHTAGRPFPYLGAADREWDGHHRSLMMLSATHPCVATASNDRSRWMRSRLQPLAALCPRLRRTALPGKLGEQVRQACRLTYGGQQDRRSEIVRKP